MVTREDLERLLDLVAGMHAAHTAFLLGMIDARVVDPDRMRAFLQALIDDLKPEERDGSYAFSLGQMIFAIEKKVIPPAPKILH